MNDLFDERLDPQGITVEEFFARAGRAGGPQWFALEPVAEGHTHAILEAACQAPSAGHLQAYQLLILRNVELQRQLDLTMECRGLLVTAPLVLAFCAEPKRSRERFGARGEQLFCVQDATIACAHAQLTARQLGLAAVWVGQLGEPETLQETLKLDAGLWPVACLAIGHPANALSVSPPSRPRDELVRDMP